MHGTYLKIMHNNQSPAVIVTWFLYDAYVALSQMCASKLQDSFNIGCGVSVACAGPLASTLFRDKDFKP